MDKNNFLNQLKMICGSDAVLVDEPMKKHTTFRIGGPADFFVMPTDADQIAQLITLCKKEEMPYTILGNGSNLLVSDEGYRGCVIQLYKNFSGIRVEGNRITADAGAMLIRVSHLAAEHALTGLEFASGIPGTIGGALVMNAGAYGGEVKQVLEKALVLTDAGEQIWLTAEELELGYRTSVIAKKGYTALQAVFCLESGEKDKIEARMDELKEARITKQPLEYPSAGSTFKRPEGYFAGKLIQDAGLRGFAVGGAQVSEKHCGFVINRGEASCADVMSLVEQVQKKVMDEFGVMLEMEIKKLGF